MKPGEMVESVFFDVVLLLEKMGFFFLRGDGGAGKCLVGEDGTFVL